MTRHRKPRRRDHLLLAALLTAIALTASTRFALADPYAPDQVIMQLGVMGSIDSVNTYWETVAIDSIPSQRIYLLHLNDPSVQDSMVALDHTLYAVYCDYNYEGQTAEARRGVIVIAIGSTGGDVEDQGAMARVRKDEAHEIATGEGALVAILDTGFELDHPFLAGRFEVAYGKDYIGQDADPSEERNGIDDDWDGLTDEGAGHGTMVAGIVATVAPDARIIPFRVLDDEGRGTIFDVVKAAYRAADMGARVINMSFGTQETSEALAKAIDDLTEVGVAITAASGNDSACVAQYPSRDYDVIGITATDSLDIKADFANIAVAIDLSAPGVGILSTYLDGGFGLGLGTSFSTAFVTGAAALLLERFPSAHPDTLRQWVMMGSAAIDSVPGNGPYRGKIGAGRVDCLGSLLVASSPTLVGAPGGAAAGAPPLDGSVITALSATPNPTAGTFLLRFDLGQEELVSLSVYSVEGRLVSAQGLGRLAAGPHAIPVEPLASGGGRLAPGRYVYRIEAGARQGVGRLTILR